MKLVTIKVVPEEELIEKIESEFNRLGHTDGIITSLFGAVDECCISNMPESDAKQDILNTYTMPLEFIGSGEISNNKVHIHCVVSKEKDHVLAGHLHWAKVKNWFIKAHILVP